MERGMATQRNLRLRRTHTVRQVQFPRTHHSGTRYPASTRSMYCTKYSEEEEVAQIRRKIHRSSKTQRKSPVTSLAHHNAMQRQPWDQSECPRLPAGWAAFLVRFQIPSHTTLEQLFPSSVHKADYRVCMSTGDCWDFSIWADWVQTAGTFDSSSHLIMQLGQNCKRVTTEP